MVFYRHYHKNKKFKKSKNWDCNKRVHGFGQKLVIYREFFRGGGGKEIGAEKCDYDILEGRNVFLYYENKTFKKLINWDFSKGISPWFWSKIGNFSRLLF